MRRTRSVLDPVPFTVNAIEASGYRDGCSKGYSCTSSRRGGGTPQAQRNEVGGTTKQARIDGCLCILQYPRFTQEMSYPDLFNLFLCSISGPRKECGGDGRS